MSLLKKLAGETALYGLSSIIARFINFLLVPLYTRQFSPNEYGVVSELASYSGFIMVLFSYRMESAYFRFGTDQEQRESVYSTAMWSLVATTLLFVGLFFVATPSVAAGLDYDQHPEYITWFALILGLDALCELPFARLRMEQRAKRFVAAKFLNIGVNVGLNLFWILFCPWAAKNGMSWVHSVWSPKIGVGYVFLANLAASAVTLLYLSPQVRQMASAFDTSLWRKMMGYSLPLVVVSFAGIINEMLDRVMMKHLLPGTLAENQAELGIYSANYKLAMLITLFTQAYRYAAEPFFFRTATEGNSLELQAKATKWFTIAAAAGMLGILLFIDLLKHFLGAKFHGGLHIVPILLLANLLLGVYYNFSVWYRLKDRTVTGAAIAVVGAFITILLNLWLVPLLGYVGAAWATLSCYIFMCAVTWWMGRELHPVPYPMVRMLGFVALALALYGVSALLRPFLSGLWAVLGVNAVLMVGYLFVAVREYRLRGI